MTSSLRVKLLLSMLLVVIVSIAILSVSIVRKQSELGYRQASNELQSLSAMVASNTTAAILFGDSGAARQTLDGLVQMPEIHHAVIYDGSGEVFTRYDRAGGVPSAVDPAHVRELLLESRREIVRDASGLYAYEPVVSEGEVVGLVFMANDMASLSQRRQEFLRLVLTTSLLALGASIVIILWLQGLISKPLGQLIDVIQQIGAERDYGQRAPSSSITEFRLLSDSFNAMVSEVDARGRKLESINLELEQRVRERTQALESALRLANEGNRAKSEFLAVMSHEVRTPLNGIIGFLEMLKIKPLEPDLRKLIDSLDRAAQTLLDLLNEILDFSKLDASKIELDINDFHLGDLVASVVESYQPLASRKGLALHLDLDAAEGHYLGDATRLKQILGNFVSNAIKFTDRGEVHVRVTTQDHCSETLATFSVEDTGIGIGSEKLKDIFAPFVQGDSSITRRYGGTGLGLAISRQLVELMQGTYGVHSEAGKGSRFWFAIPLGKLTLRPAPEPAPRDSLVEPLAAHDILVAEDNALNQEVILSLLHSLGQRCNIVDTGEQAVDKAAIRRYDLILMDYHMPDMDGVQATRLIRERAGAPNAATPIVALTADIHPEAHKRFRRAGANGVLVKPFTLADLQSCLGRWLGKPDAREAAAPEASAGDDIHPDAPPVLNIETLNAMARLSPEQGAALVARIIGIFMEQLPHQLASLRKALDEGDGKAAFQSAHSLKSSASNVGAERLFGIAGEMEHLARENHLAPARSLLARLDECSSRTVKALDDAMECVHS